MHNERRENGRFFLQKKDANLNSRFLKSSKELRPDQKVLLFNFEKKNKQTNKVTKKESKTTENRHRMNSESENSEMTNIRRGSLTR